MKKTISLVIAVCLLISICPVFAAGVGDFADVKTTDWYYDSVKYVTDAGLFGGTSATRFSPNAAMTRGMFVTVLGRYAGVSGEIYGTAAITEAINMRSGPSTDSSIVTVLHSGNTVKVYKEESGWYSVSYSGYSGYVRCDLINVSSGKFTDVKYTSYYCPYINWASSAGIVSGTGSSTFSPDRNISRQEICAILYRYVSQRNLTLNLTVSKSTFSDDGSISSAFKEAVYAMQRAGVVTGRNGNTLAPVDNASRAEVSAFMTRFIKNVGTSPKVDYSYAGTVKESAAVSNAWFDDACFIGHSIVVGMRTYYNLLNADYYAVNGISAKRMLTYSDFQLSSGETGDISAALAERDYGKVYIMLGVNELGSSDYDIQSYYDSMRSLISIVKAVQPTAKIYLISITPVTEAESAASNNFNLQNIVTFNKKLQQISRETGTGYLDFFALFCDDNGYMPQNGAAADGIHPVQSQYAIMKEYLKTHT